MSVKDLIRQRWRSHTALVAGLSLGLLFLWLAFRQVDMAGLAGAFGSVEYSGILLGAVALALGSLLRALRWGVIAGGGALSHYFRATTLGLLANLTLPGRAGEFVRVITVARLERRSLAGPLASAVLDRLVDVFVLLGSAAVLYWLLPISAMLARWLGALFLIAVLITLLVVVYANSAGSGEALVRRLTQRFLRRWQLAPDVFMAELRGELRRLLGSWLSIELLLLVLAILGADYFAVAAMLRAFGLSLPFLAPLVLWVFLAAGSALPGAPGFVGTYQVAAVWALGYFGVSATIAVAVATVLQATTLAVVVALAGPGAVSAVRRLRTQANTV